MATTLTIECLQPGGGAFLVDGGRPGLRALGIPSGGPADPRSAAFVNAVLGRSPTATCLELTMTGGKWQLVGQGRLCLGGADLPWQLNGQTIARHRAFSVKGAVTLTGGFASNGLRAYLAIAGAWQVPRRMGSAELGLPGVPAITPGWRTEVIRTGKQDTYPTGATPPPMPTLPYQLPVRPGPEWGLLSNEQQRHLLDITYTIGRSSNRQGIRLASDHALNVALPSMLSSPVLPGTVQLSPQGPILLGPAAQTVGGYPRVLLTDAGGLALAAQLGLGKAIRFSPSDS